MKDFGKLIVKFVEEIVVLKMWVSEVKKGKNKKE